MTTAVLTYLAGDSAVHRLDARVKLALAVAFSITLFLVDTLLGIVAAAALFLMALGASTVPPTRVLGMAWPVYVLAAVALLANAAPDIAAAFGGADSGAVCTILPAGEDFTGTGVAAGSGGASAAGASLSGFVTCSAPTPGVALTAAVRSGWPMGVLIAARIVLLAWASILLTLTTSSEALTAALRWVLTPLRVLHVPVDDVAFTLALALRFIPLIAQQFERLRAGMWSRGAHLGSGGLGQRLRAWGNIFIALFVELFRQADRTATAMDVRCYGQGDRPRTNLARLHCDGASAAVLCVGLLCCVLLAIFL